MPSAATDTLCRAARANGVVVVMGMTERDTDTVGGSLYNSLLYISAEGAILGVHRKLMPTHAERIVWGQGDGSGLLVVETGVGRVGGLICWEHWMPLSRFAMHAEREEIHVAAWPEVGDPEMHRFASRHYAFEGRCFSICVMGASMTAGALPEGFELPQAMGAADDFIEAASASAPRGTTIFAPDGTVVADAPAGEETIVYGDSTSAASRRSSSRSTSSATTTAPTSSTSASTRRPARRSPGSARPRRRRPSWRPPSRTARN